jgi:hypothetical protein
MWDIDGLQQDLSRFQAIFGTVQLHQMTTGTSGDLLTDRKIASGR